MAVPKKKHPHARSARRKYHNRWGKAEKKLQQATTKLEKSKKDN